ncbi:MAG: hypothetical protein K0Q95_3174 [Bacteroidota bacterium]|jgi:hypothetical protein|nr:hypothetical protein [Bacteroidota bacterium]
MKDYKLLTYRPELTQEQFKEGMDFSKVKVNAGAAKAAAFKTLLIKIGLCLTVVTGVVIYVKIKNSVPKHKSITAIDSANTQDSAFIDSVAFIQKKVQVLKQVESLPEKTQTVKDSSIDVMEGINSVQHMEPVVIVESNTAKKDTSKTLASKTANQKVKKEFKPTLNGRCVIWKSDNYCELPLSLKYVSGWDCSSCDFDNVDCSELERNLIALLVTVTPKPQQRLKLESGFKNISLVKNDGSVIHPAFLSLGPKNYFGKNFRSSAFAAHYTNEINLFLFFPDAQSGDIVAIKGLGEVMVEN